MKLIHYIFPTNENDFAPYLLQRTAFILMGGLIILSFAMTNLQSLVWLSSSWLVGAVLPAVVIEETNDERASLTANPLVRSELLDKAAELKAKDMAENGYFAHYSPTGVSPWYWLDQVSYAYAHAGENLAVHFTDSSDVVEAWMQSPTHRANIINNNYTEIGVGTAKGKYEGHETVFVVQLFGTPASAWQPPSVPVPVVEAGELESEPLVVVEAAEAEVGISDTGDEVVLGEVADLPKENASQAEVEFVSEESVSPITPAPTPTTKEEDVPSTNEALVLNETAPALGASSDESFVATSTGLAAGLNPTYSSDDTNGKVTSVASLATKPNSILYFIYLVIGSIIAALLLVSIGFGVNYHRPRPVAYGVMLLLLLTSLFVLQSHLYTSVVIASEFTAQ